MNALKSIFTVACFILLSDSFAQLGLQFEGGLTSSLIKVESSNGNASWTTEFTRRYSAHLGVLTGGKISDYFALRSGLYFSSRGTTITETTWPFFGGVTNTAFKLSYLELPFLFSFEPSSICIFFGPQYSALLSAKIEDTDMKSALKSGSFDLRYGIGVQPPRGIGFKFQFISGLSDILKSTEEKWKSNSINATVLYVVSSAPPKSGKKRNTDIPHRSLD